MNPPARIVSADVAFILINEMRRIADDQVPFFRAWNVLEIIRLIDRNPIAEIVGAHSVPTGSHRCRIDVRNAEGLAKAMSKQGKRYERGARTPLKKAFLPRHLASLEK